AHGAGCVSRWLRRWRRPRTRHQRAHEQTGGITEELMRMKSLVLFSLGALVAATAATAAPANYTIDPDHTFPSFEADHMGISFWRGKMNKNTGKMVLDKDAG